MAHKHPDELPSQTEVNDMRAWLVVRGVPANVAAQIAVAANTRREIARGLRLWLKARVKRA